MVRPSLPRPVGWFLPAHIFSCSRAKFNNTVIYKVLGGVATMKYSKAISMIEKGMIFTDELKDTCLSALRFAEKHKSKMIIPSKAYIVVPGALLYGYCRCGQLVASNMKFCTECGAGLKWDDVELEN